MKEAVPLFVYGSLMSGLKHHDQLAGARRLGDAQLMGHHLVLYEGAYPALVPGPPRNAPLAGSTLSKQAQLTVVVGEVFVVEPEHLQRLDLFEECPDLYQRIQVSLVGGMLAQAYAVTGELALNYPPILGNFREYLGSFTAHSPS